MKDIISFICFEATLGLRQFPNGPQFCFILSQSQDPKIKAKNSRQSRERQLEKHDQDGQDADYGLWRKLSPSMLSSSLFCVTGLLVGTMCPSPVVSVL